MAATSFVDREGDRLDGTGCSLPLNHSLNILVVRVERKSNPRHSRPINGRDCLLSYGEILAMICRTIDGLGQPGEFPEGLRVSRSVHPGSLVAPRMIWASPQISALNFRIQLQSLPKVFTIKTPTERTRLQNNSYRSRVPAMC